MTYNKLSSDIIDLPIENMINPVEGSIIRAFSGTTGKNDGVDIKVTKGTKVKAAAQGTIAQIAKSRVDETFVVLLRSVWVAFGAFGDIVAGLVGDGEQ